MPAGYRLLYKQLLGVLDAAGPAKSRLFTNWNFHDLIGNKMLQQIKTYNQLPTLSESIDQRLEKLLPRYANELDTSNADSVHSLMLKFMDNNNPNKEASFQTAQVNNLRAYIIKYEIQKEYMDIRKFREGVLSVKTDDDDSDYDNKELLVNTYTNINMIQFVRLLHDNTFFYSSPYNYYSRFAKLFNIIVNDETVTKAHGLCKKLRPADVEKLIQRLIYCGKVLSDSEQLQLKMNDVNKTLIGDLRTSRLKLSNKELFSLLQLSFKNSTSLDDLKFLYDNFLSSETFQQNDDFFKHFLEYNISLALDTNIIRDEEFTKRIISDLARTEIKPDRYMLKYLLKYSWIVQNDAMTDVLLNYLFENYAMDKDILQHIGKSVSVYNDSQYQSITNVIDTVVSHTDNTQDPFLLRLFDHVDDLLGNQPAYPGIIFK